MSHIFPFRERMGSDMVRENNPCETKKSNEMENQT